MSRNPRQEFQNLFNEIVESYGLHEAYDLETAFDNFAYTLDDAIDANETLGETAYDAMRSQTGSTSPTWSQLDQGARESWISVALAVRAEVV